MLFPAAIVLVPCERFDEPSWSTFVGRGVDIRGALDSSLDEIETVRPMDFLESRSLVRHRGEQMSDSQILLCHVLGGGLPREVLRSARLLSGIVRLRTGDQTLADAGPSLIDAHLAVLVEGMEPQLGAFNRDVAAVVRARIEHLDRTWSDSSRARDTLDQLSGQDDAELPPDAQEILRQVRNYGEFLLVVRETLFGASAGVWLDQFGLLAWAEAHTKSQRRMDVDLGPLNAVKREMPGDGSRGAVLLELRRSDPLGRCTGVMQLRPRSISVRRDTYGGAERAAFTRPERS